MDVTKILQQCQNPDQNARQAAEKMLVDARDQNLGAFYMAMSGELCNDAKPKTTRQLAGLMIKNCLDAQDTVLAQQRAEQWLKLDERVRAAVKTGVVQGLASTLEAARNTCAQVIAKIARIEVPQKAWPEIVDILMSNTTTQGSPSHLVQASLSALGYLCEEVDPTDMDQVALNKILTAIVYGMKSKDAGIMLQGCSAMFNALDFVRMNFESKTERDVIMQQICENTTNPEARIRRKAYECIWRVAELYYEKLQGYMQALFQITLKTVREDSQEVAMQALEFWLTICDKEADLMSDPDGQSANYIQGALTYLMPLVTETLTKQEDDQDEDSWNLSMAGGACLALIASVVGADILKPIMPFVTQHVRSPDWHYREAAMLAFGSVMSEQTCAQMEQMVFQALPVVLEILRADTNEHVKDTTAWTLGQICGYYGARIPKNVMDSIVTTLLTCLTQAPRVANNAAFACHNLALSVETVGGADAASNILSPYIRTLVEKLLACAERSDWDEHNLRTTAYEAVNLIMACAAQDSIHLVKNLVPHLCNKLAHSLQMSATSPQTQKEQFALQGLLCGALQTTINKLQGDVLPTADTIMQQLLQVFSVESATAHEEAFMAIGALANAVDEQFEKYMQAFAPMLKRGLAEHEHSQICIVATGVVGDVARALEGKILPYCDAIVTLLVQNLQNNRLDKECKPAILAVFGDIALAIGPNFEKYLQASMTMLQQAGGVTPPEDDDEMADYVAKLHDNVLDAYAGIIQGLKGDGSQPAKGHLLEPFKNHIGHFLGTMTMNPNRDESQTRNIAGVLGDLASCMGASVKAIVTHRFVALIVADCDKSSDNETQVMGKWLRGVITQIPK